MNIEKSTIKKSESHYVYRANGAFLNPITVDNLDKIQSE